MLRKTLAASVLVGTIFSALLANAGNDVAVKMSGGFDFQAGIYKSKAPAGYRNLSKHREDLAFKSQSHLGIHAKNTLDSGLTYGAKVGIETTTLSNRKSPSSLYIESDAGKVELGSDKSAFAKMKVTAYSVGAATAGGWDTWVNTDPKNSGKNKMPFTTSFSNWLDAKTRKTGKTEYSRKVTYYTPEYNGFQAGISFIPDSSNLGFGSVTADNSYEQPTTDYKFAIKNGLAGAVSYKAKLNEDVKVKLAVGGEHGKVTASNKNENNLSPTPKFKNLRTYTVGGEVTYKEFAVAASYANNMKSLTSAEEKYRNTDAYGVGGRYRMDKFTTSINYFHSNHQRNKLDATTLAVDYKLAPGLLPYAEVTYFVAKGNRLNPKNPDEPGKHKLRGTFFLLGTKLEF